MSNTKGFIFWIFFKISQFFTRNLLLKILGFPIRIFYKLLFNWVFGIDIPDTTVIGEGFNMFHGQGLIINSQTIIGNNVIVRQNTTIGNSHKKGGSPVIHDNVDIGANSVIIGEITIGANSVIAAGSIVIRNVEPNTIVAGNPARFIKIVSHV